MPADVIKKDSLADTAKPDQDNAPGCTLQPDAVERDRRPLDHFVAPGQFRRRIAGARRVGVCPGVHFKQS